MDAEDDTMYEVELMLGETDESHIIRTIEYWDNEKRRWPQRQHYAVLVAEHINRRFFNVIHLLSLSIPMIAVQVSMLEVNGSRTLYFSKILDTYEEPDVVLPTDTSYDRDYWQKKAPWTLEAADTLLAKTQDLFTDAKLNYVKDSVGIKVGYYVCFRLHKRTADKSILIFPIAAHLQDEAAALLDDKEISYVKKPKRFRITVDKQMIGNNVEVLRSIAELVKKSIQADG